MKRGVVFSMDTAYAVFIILLASATIVALLNSSQQKTTSSLYLSRAARDIQDTNQSLNGGLTGSDVGHVKVNDCENADQVGTHRAVVYDGGGSLKVVKTEVCPG